jgi:hypothetical protein
VDAAAHVGATADADSHPPVTSVSARLTFTAPPCVLQGADVVQPQPLVGGAFGAAETDVAAAVCSDMLFLYSFQTEARDPTALTVHQSGTPDCAGVCVFVAESSEGRAPGVRGLRSVLAAAASSCKAEGAGSQSCKRLGPFLALSKCTGKDMALHEVEFTE